MNHGDPGQRMREHSNGDPSNGPPRPPPVQQNGIGGAPGGLFPPGAASVPKTTMSRAEKFEDEKRRIIESCFSKRDADGSGQPSHDALMSALDDTGLI